MNNDAIDAFLAETPEVAASEAFSDKTALLLYQAAADFVKVALYCLFLLNGGALTIFASKGLGDFKHSLISFAVGIIFAVITNVTAYDCSLSGGHKMNRFRPEGEEIDVRIFRTFYLTCFCAVISIGGFICGCFLALP